MMFRFLLVCLLFVCVLGANPPTARVKNGTYEGVYSAGYDQDFFLGMPYAQPPVGNLRFRIPVPLNKTWTGTKYAGQYSGECVGYGSDQWNYNISEDCLYINVIRPASVDYTSKTLPVAVWIHGGGYFEGGGVDQRYNASFMVHNSAAIGKPIMVVNLNYRLSAWGFLSSNEIAGQGATNLGLRDQRLALHWVQENIAAFGGDPSKVTIWGESAGASSVGFHLTAYNGRDDGLFRGAMMESGNPVNYGALYGPEGYQSKYNTLVNRTNCNGTLDTLQCLRDLPFATLNAAINTTTNPLVSFGPFLDGDFLARFTSLQLADGHFVRVPILSGANSDEGSAFSPQGVNTTQDLYNYMVRGGSAGSAVPASLAIQLLKAYPDNTSVNVIQDLGDSVPGPPYGAQFRRSASYFGDAVFIANRRLTCATWAAANVSAYCYRFNALTADVTPTIGVTHFQEIAYVFYNLEGVGYEPVAVKPFTNLTDNYRTLAKYMDSCWVSFVHDQDPNSWRTTAAWNGTEELWPVYSVDNPMDYVFDANVSSHAESDTFRSEGINLINKNNVGVYHR